GRVPAALLLPLHPLSRPRDDAEDRRRPLPRHPEDARRQGTRHLLPGPRGAGPQEEAVDERADRLAQAPPPRGHAARRAAVAGPEEGDPAAPRGAPQERTGRDAVRAPRLYGAAAGRLRRSACG